MSADRTVQHVVSATTTARSVLRLAPVSVDDELYRFGLEGLRHSRGYSEDYQQLWASLHDTARAGKRFRSSLLLASFDAHGGGDAHAAARVAAAMELLHAAFVIHDDVIDKDLRRRGAPNVSGTFVERARLRDVDTGADEGLHCGDAQPLRLGEPMRFVAPPKTGRCANAHPVTDHPKGWDCAA